MNLLASLACMLIVIAISDAQPNNLKYDLWLRYQSPMYNYYRSHSYVQSRNQKNLWRLPNTFRIQGKRAVGQNETTESMISICYYNGSSVLCGQSSMNNTIECPVAKRFEDRLLEQMPIFALSDAHIVTSPEGLNTTKFYMYARYVPNSPQGILLASLYKKTNVQRPVVSLHSVENIQDNGLTVIDKTCWTKLVNFLNASPKDTLFLHESGLQRNISGALIFL